MTLNLKQEKDQYCWPEGFGFDQNYKQYITFDPEDPHYKEANYTDSYVKKMEHLRKVVKKMLDNQKGTDDIYLAFGCDFAFTQAEINYHNLDKVIKMWNSMYPDVELKYSNQKNVSRDGQKD